MRAARAKLAERGTELAVIVQARPDELRTLCGAELHCIADPRRESHTAFGLQHTSPWGMFFSLAFHRRRRAATAAGFHQDWRRTFARESDTLLAPGAALVARGGRILWAYHGEHPGDLPTGDDLVAIASEFTTSVRR